MKTAGKMLTEEVLVESFMLANQVTRETVLYATLSVKKATMESGLYVGNSALVDSLTLELTA